VDTADYGIGGIQSGTPTEAEGIATEVIAEQIRAEHAKVTASSRDAVRHAIEAGRLLLEAKAVVGHGGWGPWLTQNCDEVSPRTAQDYMRLAEHYGSNPQRAADLPTSIREALRIAARDNKERLERLCDPERQVARGLPSPPDPGVYGLCKAILRRAERVANEDWEEDAEKLLTAFGDAEAKGRDTSNERSQVESVLEAAIDRIQQLQSKIAVRS
jgi:hypothetical protein